MISCSSSFVALGILSAVAFGSTIAFYMKFRKKVYKRVAQIKSLIIYPVKSLGGVEVDTLEMTKSGVKFGPFRDRSFLIIDGKNQMITQRQVGKLALVKTSFHGEDELWLEAEGLDILRVKAKHSVGESDIIVDTRVWGKPCQGVDMGEEASQWFQSYLRMEGTRLIQHVPLLKMRPMKILGDKQFDFDPEMPIRYQDSSPCHLINEHSIEDLSERLGPEIPVNYRSFRPNILVNDCNPYEEDHWHHLEINGLSFAKLRPTERCKVPNIDQKTGEADARITKEMKKYRLSTDPKHKALFGINPLVGVHVVPARDGFISIGQDVAAVWEEDLGW